MEVTVEDLFIFLRIEQQDANPNNEQNERLCFEVENLKSEERNQICEVTRRRRRRSKSQKKLGSGGNMIPSMADMTISTSCRYRLSVPLMFWTTAFLILLAKGVNSFSDEQARFSRSPKYDQEGDVQGGLIPPSIQDSYNVVQFLRELMQRLHQRANQQQVQVYNNGEDLSESQIDWRKLPLPLLYQIRSIINDGSKEEGKRGSYMSLCHFKICNLG